MIKESKFRRQPVELGAEPRPSRIRRDPVPGRESERLAKSAWWNSDEWEIRLAIGGIVFFALAIAAVVIDLGEFLSR